MMKWGVLLYIEECQTFNTRAGNCWSGTSRRNDKSHERRGAGGDDVMMDKDMDMTWTMTWTMTGNSVIDSAVGAFSNFGRMNWTERHGKLPLLVARNCGLQSIFH
jgi:hypothetical protein